MYRHILIIYTIYLHDSSNVLCDLGNKCIAFFVDGCHFVAHFIVF